MPEDIEEEVTYEIVRFYADTMISSEVLKSGLTLEEAKEHCSNPETASDTCTSLEGTDRTERCGNWFEGFRRE